MKNWRQFEIDTFWRKALYASTEDARIEKVDKYAKENVGKGNGECKKHTVLIRLTVWNSLGERKKFDI